ncbi:MAG: hypothetical protein JXP37_07985, partial [Coriobacteriia bacterium]|nr:hypothetical protein [Coriobacteriia bacterium]
VNIIESHGWLVSVGELPELVRGKLHEKLVPAPDETGSNVAGISARQTPEFVPESPASMGSWGELNGTLTVTGPDETHTITEEELTALDDEPTTVGTKKRGKKSS